MSKKRLIRLFQQTKLLQANALVPAAESQNADGVEREYAFYGKLEDPEQLNKAAYYIDQEQWRIDVECKDDRRGMMVRIRKETITKKFANGDHETPSDPQYYLALKTYVKGQPGTTEVEVEISPTVGQDLLEIFAQEGNGMIKRRYVFPLTGEAAERFNDEDRPHWEVDAFWSGTALRMRNWQHHPAAVRCLQPYVKLDLEVKNFDLKVQQDPNDGEYVGFDLPFPIELSDVVYSQPHQRTERDKGRVEAILLNYMMAKAPKPALTPATEQSVTQTIETLFKNKWLSLMKIKAPEMGVNGYVYSHESRCKGRIVAVLPYRRAESTIQYLIKSEITPSWSLQPSLSALTGGWEGDDIVQDAKRELLEESGYDVDVSEFVSLGECYASKSADTVYSLFSVDLTNAIKQTHEGDGSRLEAIAESPWVEEAALLDVMDPQVHVMLNRLKVHLRAIEK